MHFALKLTKSKTGQILVWATWETANGVLCKKRLPDNDLVRLWFEQCEDSAQNEPVGSVHPIERAKRL